MADGASSAPGISPAADVLTASNLTASIPNSRQLVNGTNTTIDTSVPGQIKVNASGGGGGGSAITINTAGTTLITSTDEFITADLITAAGAITIQLPAVPVAGEIHYVTGLTDLTPGQDLIIDGNGNIVGPSSDPSRTFSLLQVISTERIFPLFIYWSGAGRWDVQGGGIPTFLSSILRVVETPGTTEFYQDKVGETPGTITDLVIKDPGSANVQQVFASPAGAATNSQVFWQSGPSQGGHLKFYQAEAFVGTGTFTIDDATRWVDANPSGGTLTVEFPLSPTQGQEIQISANITGADLLVLDGNGNDLGAFASPLTIGAAFGSYIFQSPLIFTFNAAQGSWLCTSASNATVAIAEQPLVLFEQANSGFAYSIIAAAPAQNTGVSVLDPGAATVQMGMVDLAGGTTGQVPVWNAGPGTGGYFSLVAATPGFDSNTVTTLAGSTSGNFRYNMPEQATGHKKFIVVFDSVTDAGVTLNFPTAFTYTPSITGNGTGLTFSNPSTTQLVIPATTAATGVVVVEGI
jgi:hypothetical protein